MGHFNLSLSYLLMTKLSDRASSSSMLFTAKGDVCAESLYAFVREYSLKHLSTRTCIRACVHVHIRTCIHIDFYHTLRHAFLSPGLAEHEYQPVSS
jgi:hypothetical protein